jgi:hypothetical protein
MTSKSIKSKVFYCALIMTAVALARSSAADAVFSGPQVGEKTTPFKVLELTGGGQGKERDPITENAGAPTVTVFVHAVERSLVPLVRVIDQYGAERNSRIKTEVVFLFGDRIEGEQRGKTVANSLRLKSRVGLSLDGAEGPGNYGLNKECMMTVVAAKNNQVTANFAFVQPGIADAPKIIEALAKTCGDTSPPSIEQLSGPAVARGSAREAGRMQNEAGTKSSSTKPETKTEESKPKESFPGAVPTDPTLNSLLRQMIRPATEDAAVDKLFAQMKEHIQGNPDLTKQAMDGWVRVLHFGDRYGTPHSRKIGREFLDSSKQSDGVK